MEEINEFSIDHSSSHTNAPLLGNDFSETKLPEMSKRGGTSNLRDSLSWDIEFLTSSGVLNPEELSIITGDINKGSDASIYVNKKDNNGSTDSLESLEAELFEDIRASTTEYKVDNPRNKEGFMSTNPKSSTTVIAAGSSCKEAICSSNKSEIVSQKRFQSNCKPVTKMTPTSTQRSGKMTRKDSSSSQVTQSSARIGDNVRPPRANPSSTPRTKVACLGVRHLKNEIPKPKRTIGTSSKEARASKLTSLVGPRLDVSSKPILSSKSSVVSTKRQPTRFSSACDTSIDASCGNSNKYHLVPTRVNTNSRTVDQSKGGSSPKTSQDITQKKKEPSYSQNSGGNENRVTGRPNQNTTKGSTQSVIVTPSSSLRPSRSQMLSSPKIYILNGEKPVIISPMQSPSRSSLALSKTGGGMNSPNRVFKAGDEISSPKRLFKAGDGIGSPKRLFKAGDGISSPKRLIKVGEGIGSPKRLFKSGDVIGSPKRLFKAGDGIGSPKRLINAGEGIGSPKRLFKSGDVIGSPKRLFKYGDVIGSPKRLFKSGDVIGSPKRLLKAGDGIGSPNRLLKAGDGINSPKRLFKVGDGISSPNRLFKSGDGISNTKRF